MLTPWRRLAKLLLWPVVFLSIGSGFPGCGTGAYGMPEVTYDPQVKVKDFSYTPARQASPGDELTFTVTLNQAAQPYHLGRPYAQIGNPDHTVVGLLQLPYLIIDIHDDGLFPDALAGDNVWTGAYTLPANLPPQTGLPVTARYGEWQRGALDLEILPED